MDKLYNQLISRPFLTKVLGEQLEILEFKTTNGTKPGDNFMSVIYSIQVVCKTQLGEEVNRDLFIKCYPSHPSRQEHLNRSNIFFKELQIYQIWIPELIRFQTEVIGLEIPVKLPYAPFLQGKCIDFVSVGKDRYAGKVIEPLDNYIILEDLRKSEGFRMTNRRESMDIDHMRLVMVELAKTHALSWAYKCHVEKDVLTKYPCLTTIGMSMPKKPMWTNLLNDDINQSVAALDQALGVGNHLSMAMVRFQGIFGPVLDVILGGSDGTALDTLLRMKPDPLKFGKDSSDPVPWRVISHGDCWSNNILFRYDEITKKPIEVILVDLQTVRQTCITLDLAYVIFSSTDSVLRKNHLDELLQLYFDSFNSFCDTFKTETLPGFTFESFKYRFHRSKLIGLVNAIVTLPHALKDEKDSEGMNLENMEDGKDMAEMFSDIGQSKGINPVFNERLIGLLQDLSDDGVI